MKRHDEAPRDLLFGLLALQNGMVARDQLVAAFGASTAAPGKPLADILAEQGHLRPEHRPLLEALVEAHLRLHGGDPERSLAALDVNRSTHESLAAAGVQVETTLAHVGSGADGDTDRTASYAVGTPTSDGQRFRVLRPHARGGLGAVFVALDQELHREVALKQILGRHADDAASRAVLARGRGHRRARASGNRAGLRSDVYSLGATLYCLLTAKPPQEGNDLGELLRKVQRGEFQRTRQHDASIEAALEAVCLKAMALKPDDRYATPRLLAEDIERWMADEPVTAWREPFSRRARRWARRNRTVVIANIMTKTLANAGSLFRHTKRLDDALRASMQGHELAERAVRERPGDLTAARNLLDVSLGTTELLWLKGRLHEARPLCRRSIAFGEALLREHPRDFEIRWHLVGLMVDLAALESVEGRALQRLDLFQSG